MSDVAALSVGLHLNAAHFRTQLNDNYGFAEQRTNRFHKSVQDGAKKSAGALSLINKEINFSVKNLLALSGAGLSLNAVINTSRQYGQSLSDLSAITGVTGHQLTELDNIARKLGRSTEFSAIQVIEAYKSIASAKPELLEVSGGLAKVTESALTLAQASGSSLPEAAKTVTLSLSQFNAGIEDTDRYINVLAAGAKFGASEINETSLAIKNSGVAAAQANLSFEQLNAGIQVLADREIKGGEAGTALRNVILKLEKSTDQSLKPSVVGLVEALDNLDKKQLSTAQAVRLFGLENINAASILIQSRGKLATLTQQLTGTNTAYEQSSIRINNLNADLKQLGGAFEGIAINIGQAGDGPLRSGVQVVTSAVNLLSDNFNAVANIATYTLIPVLATKLTAGLRSSSAAWIEQAAKVRQAAIFQAATAKATIENAQATITLAQSQAKALATQSALNRQHGINISYQKEHQVISRQIREATLLEADAKRKLFAANSQLSISNRALSGATGLAKGALSMIGGPFGAAMLAGSALVYFANQASQAKADALGLAEKVEQLNDKFEEMSEAKLKVEMQDAKKNLDNVLEQLTYIGIQIKDNDDRAKMMSSLPDSMFGGQLKKLAAARNDLVLEQEEMLNSLDRVQTRMSKIGNELSIGPRRPTKPKQDSNGEGNKPSLWGGSDKNKAIEQYKQLYREIEIANASSLERIGLQEQQARQKLIEEAKKANVSKEELEKGLNLVSERYARERVQIAEKYNPASVVVRQAQETNKELEALYQQQLITKEQYQARLVDPTQQLRAANDPNSGIQQEYELKLTSLRDYQLQEQVLLEEARNKNEIDEQIYQQRLLEISEHYSALKLKAERSKTQSLQETNQQAAQMMFNVTSQFASLTSDLIQQSGRENNTGLRALLAIQKALAIPSIMVQTQVAASAARAQESLMGGYLSGEMAAKLVEAQGAISVGIVASQAISGMAHNGIDNIPQEGTWLLDKGERVVDSRTNEDLKSYLNNSKGGRGAAAPNYTYQQTNIFQIENIAAKGEDGDDSVGLEERFLKAVTPIIEQRTYEILVKEQRNGGQLRGR